MFVPYHQPQRMTDRGGTYMFCPICTWATDLVPPLEPIDGIKLEAAQHARTRNLAINAFKLLAPFHRQVTHMPWLGGNGATLCCGRSVDDIHPLDLFNYETQTCTRKSTPEMIDQVWRVTRYKRQGN